MIRSRVAVLAALLLVLAVPAAIAQGPAKGPAPSPAQNPAQIQNVRAGARPSRACRSGWSACRRAPAPSRSA